MKLALYGKGVRKTRAGHLRYTSPKELRDKYVHRVVIDRLIEETAYSIRLMLPWPWEVHHIDFNKENNKPDNLLVLHPCFHSKVTVDGHKRVNGKFNGFNPKWKPAPEWVLFEDKGEEIPF